MATPETPAIAVRVSNVKKSFKLPHEQSSGIKQLLINRLRGIKGYEQQRVLNDVSFEVKAGEFFGIVGRNGSGKSTMLKLLATIYEPESGTVEVNGSLTPFIELGVGFNPELTGRENVFLNGALLGFSRKEMQSMYDDIVEFAELERFMDQKLKNYSSGMQVRLAFSIAIRAESDILLVDEVLAVGDANFQEKCLAVFEELKRQKKTIIFISHDMSMVKRFCDRVIMLKNGKIVHEGKPLKVAEKYELDNIPAEQTLTGLNSRMETLTNKIITRMNVKNSAGKSATSFTPSEKITFEIKLAEKSVAKNFGVAIYSSKDEYVFGTNTLIDGATITTNEFRYTVNAPEGRGQYYFKIGVFGKDDSEILEFYDRGPVFQVIGENEWGGSTFLEHSWGTKKN
jgi:ABC-2 type transport system ATP-binding protein